MSRLYALTVTVTYEGQVRAASKQDAEEMVIADSGFHLTHQTDVSVEVNTPIRAASETVRCEECDGTGTISAQFIYGLVQMDCIMCDGKGHVAND